MEIKNISNNNATMVYSDRKQIAEQNNTSVSPKNKIKISLILIGIILLLIALIVFLVIFFLKKGSSIKPNCETDTTCPKNETNQPIEPIEPLQTINPIQPISPISPLESRKLEKEFEIVTTPGVVNRISVIQKSEDKTKTNGNSFTVNSLRKTNYDIYIISEMEADENHKKYYSKMYTAAISVVSECNVLDADDCQPEIMIDFTGGKKMTESNVRILNSVDDYKDLPIPLCLFTITDNDFITSITCPESFPEIQKNIMLLDLYFFRPPAIERADKENNNITVIKSEDKDKNRKYIREMNGGLCNINNNLGSLCTTDMNTTTDLEGHLLQYDELAITNIKTDEDNYFIKTKETHLVDETEKINNLDPYKYKQSLDNLLPFLEPYMKEDIQITDDDFEDIFNIIIYKSKNQLNKLNKIKKKRKYRNLLDLALSNDEDSREAYLFQYRDVQGVDININLVNEPSIKDGNALKMYSNLNINNENTNLVYLRQESNISMIIDKISVLSKSANHLTTELYNNTKEKLNNITTDISNKISDLNNLIDYYEISDIFDSTLSLPYLKYLNSNVIAEISNLNINLKKLYNEMTISNLREHGEYLNNYIFNFISHSHSLIKDIFDNLKELGRILKSVKNKLTEITTYYLNYTSSSYVDTVHEAKNILDNYYINEKNILMEKIEKILNNFETSTNDAIDNDIKTINILYNNLENRTYIIESNNEEDYEKIIKNLNDSKICVSDIINKVKEFINDEIGLKDNGFFISDGEIKNNNDTFSPVILETDEISRKLDNDELIDALFDKIMINFRQNYTNIIKYMEEKKYSKFVLEEDTLKDSFFENKTNMETKMKELRSVVVNKIKNENKYYLDNVRTNISKFISEDLEQLNSFISDLNLNYFSEDSLKKLLNSYEKAFNSCLSKIMSDIKKNENKAKDYFDKYYNTMNDNNYLINLLKNYKIENIPRTRNYYYIVIFFFFIDIWVEKKEFKRFEDYITSKYKTTSYVSKYNEYIQNFEYSKAYITNDLYLDLVSEYKKALSSIRDVLQSLKNSRITEKYPDFEELKFYNDHMDTIDELFVRLNKYFSDSIFNNKFIPLINSDKKKDIDYINSVIKYINNKHQPINKLSLANDNVNDFCLGYRRKICYGCTNCAWYTYTYDSYCLSLPSPTNNNHLSLIKSEIKSDTNLIEFQNNFSDFISELKTKINYYNSKINELEEKINLVKNDTLNQKITNNYLKDFDNWINSTLLEKYGNNILHASYGHYQKIIEENLGAILNNISSKWKESFNYLLSEVEQNKDNFKSTRYEFGIMAHAYESVITTNITKTYFESIEQFQRTEFNYTISFYYDYFIRIINEAYLYIVGNIPINKNGFSDILNQRKIEVKNNFNIFIKNINSSFNEIIDFKQQKYILHASEDDFFNVYTILSENIVSTSRYLQEIYESLYDFDATGDEYSVVSRFYLENSENGKQIEQFYSSVKDNSFVELYLYKFKDLLINNWIFDKYSFISSLNESLLNLTKDTEKNVKIINQTNSEILEKEITKLFDDSIENKICDFYSSELILDTNNINKIKETIEEIIDEVKNSIKNEGNRLNTTPTSYNNDYSKINDTLSEIKNEILNQLNTTLFSVLEGFYSNMYQNIYINYIESGLKNYTNEVKKITKEPLTCKEFTLLNSTYKIGNIIDDLLKKIVDKYKEKTKITIDNQYQQYYKKIKNMIDFENSINQIDSTYKSYLKPALEKFANHDPGTQYSTYDFNDEIKNNITSKINENIPKINNLISLVKGDNYQVDIYLDSWKIMRFTKVGYEIISPMCSSFYTFFESEETEQNSKVNEFLNERIVSNFNDLLNNIIPTFGNQFFERIIKYNENFKINNLYDNFRFSIAETLLYYYTLEYWADIDALPKELQIRLFNLNDLDSIISKKNKQILESLEKIVQEFIKESRITIINKYMSYLQNDAVISISFNDNILRKINMSLASLMPEMGNKYIEILDIYLKQRLISSYKKTLEDKTNEIINYVEEKKEDLKSQIGNFFSLGTEQVLTEVNQKINNTLKAIENYKEYFESFEIPNSITEFLNDYGNQYIHPLFKKMKTELNKETKNIILNNIENNSQKIENLNSNDFNEVIDNCYTYFNNNYINNISDDINSYGNNTSDISKNLNEQRMKKNNNLRRRLDGEQTEEDIANESQERIFDQGVEENFQKIIESLNNIKINLDTLDAFKDLDKKINNNIDKINDNYKKSKKIIEENEYKEDIRDYLIEKLINLTNISKKYNNEINESYYNLKEYLNKSIEDINNKINNCAKITYKIFNQEFEKIVNETKPSHNSISETENIENDLPNITYDKSEHKTTSVNYSLTDMKKEGEFTFDIKYKQDNIKKLIIIAKIINRNKPKKTNIDINYAEDGRCNKVINNLDIEFNEVNYTMDIIFNSETNKINISTYTLFEEYKYFTETYKYNGSSARQAISTGGNTMYVSNNECKKQKKIILKEKEAVIVGETNENSSSIFNI